MSSGAQALLHPPHPAPAHDSDPRMGDSLPHPGMAQQRHVRARTAGSAGGGGGGGGSAHIDTNHYYGQYHGHPVDDLREIVAAQRAQGKNLVWLAGDSSLDNKYWFHEQHEAVNGYEELLSPPTMKADVTYWLNREAVARTGGDGAGAALAVINTAIEATALNDRACGRLLEQDQLIRDEIGPDDTLIVSIGGNDVALQPVICTVCAMCALVYTPMPAAALRCCACAAPLNLGPLNDLGCYGCGVPNCLTSVLCGWPLGFPYMVDLMKVRVGNYVRNLTSHRRPKRVIVCMIYHLDEQGSGSWADCALTALCYDCLPGRLQTGIEMAYVHGTQRIDIPGTETVAFPLFEVLDGKTTADYIQRVEPSPQGGRKMAQALMTAVLAPVGSGSVGGMRPATMDR
jgi:hypothetical protein